MLKRLMKSGMMRGPGHGYKINVYKIRCYLKNLMGIKSWWEETEVAASDI
jgi:hypothetical protein